MPENDEFFEVLLPPQPDPETGRPRPPRAPVGLKPGNRSSGIRNARKPYPPPGQSPALECYRESPRNAVVSGIGGFFLVSLCTGLLLDPDYWYDLGSAWMWLLPLISGFLITVTIGVGHCCAGAGWFARGNSWVTTYNLTSIKVTIPQNDRYLDLEDSAGRQLRLPLATAQANKDLWDLVYNGILHSASIGDADINTLAGNDLRLFPSRPDLN